MLAMRTLRLLIGELLGENLPLVQPTDELIVRLVSASFVLDENLVVGDLTFADFDGSTGIEVPPATDWNFALDPNTDEQLITAPEPAGGWRWEVTGTTNLPQTIFGYALVTAASASLLAVELLPEPIVLDGVGQEINLGIVRFRANVSPLT